MTATTCTFYLTCTELRLFTRVVQSFVHGSISWKLDKDARHAINHWTALCTHRITGKSVHEESTKPVVKMVAWILYWQNRKVGRVARRSHTFWPRQEMLRTLHGIRLKHLRNGSTKHTMFEGLDIGTSTQDFERLLGIEPRGCTLAGLTPVERAELEDRREKWGEDLRLRKPVDGDSSEEEDDDDFAGGGDGGDAAGDKPLKSAAERQAEAVAADTLVATVDGGHTAEEAGKAGPDAPETAGFGFSVQRVWLSEAPPRTAPQRRRKRPSELRRLRGEESTKLWAGPGRWPQRSSGRAGQAAAKRRQSSAGGRTASSWSMRTCVQMYKKQRCPSYGSTLTFSCGPVILRYFDFRVVKHSASSCSPCIPTK